MIVDQNERAGVRIKGASQDFAGIDRKPGYGSARDDLVSQQPVAAIEEHDAQLLDAQIGHGCDKIVDQRSIGPGNCTAANAFAQAVGDRFADRRQRSRGGVAVADDLLEHGLRLGQDATETVEPGDQPIGDCGGLTGSVRCKKPLQDRSTP